jgi:hypothetical protein
MIYSPPAPGLGCRPFQIGAIANQSQQHEHSDRAEAIHIKKYAECELRRFRADAA